MCLVLSMNSVKISYDGRITFWNARLGLSKVPTPKPREKSEVWELFVRSEPEVKERLLLRILGSSHVTNSDGHTQQRVRAARGTRGITPHGRSLVRMGAQFLEDRFGLKHLTFLTATLPESARAVCTRQTWAELVDRFRRKLRALLEKASLHSEIVGCVEIQEKRWSESGGSPPLHLHLLFHGRHKGSTWACRPAEFQDAWESSCLSVWNDAEGFQSSVRVESLRSSGVSYLGKYMSKGLKIASSIPEHLCPPSWHLISDSLRRFVKSQEFRCTGEVARDLFRWVRDSEVLLWAKDIWSSQCADGSFFLMAWCGAIRSRDDYWSLIGGARHLVQKRIYRNTEIQKMA